MRRTANADLAAFHKIDACGAGFDAHVATAAQHGFRLAVDDLDTHGSVDGDGFAVDDPTESDGGSSGRAAAAASSAAQRMATQAAGTAARRRHSNELEKAVTR